MYIHISYVHLYIYIYICMYNTPPNKNTLEKLRVENTKSGAGEEFPLLLCRAEARAKEECVCFTGAGTPSPPTKSFPTKSP